MIYCAWLAGGIRACSCASPRGTERTRLSVRLEQVVPARLSRGMAAKTYWGSPIFESLGPQEPHL